jgi:hypothetical protein
MSLDPTLLFVLGIIAFVALGLVGQRIRRRKKQSTIGSRVPMDTTSQLHRWREIYRRDFGIELGDVRIPERRSGFNRLIVVAKGLTIGQVFKVLGRRFSTWSYYDDLDAMVTENERTNTEAYAVWVKDVVEADEDLKNLSAREIRDRGLATMTLLERLAYELVYNVETGGHLDIDNFTLCAGSRNSDGHVPLVHWDPDDRELFVYWNDPGSARSSLRARAVVS